MLGASRSLLGGAAAAFALILFSGVAAGAGGPGSDPSARSAGKAIHCIGSEDSCGVSLPIGGQARTREVTIKLPSSHLALVEATTTPAKSRRRVGLSNASYDGANYQTTVTTSKRSPQRTRLHLIFAAGSKPGPAGPALGDRRDGTAKLNLGKGMSVSIVGGGGGTSNCTTDETNTTFVTDGSDDEAHSYGFESRGSGSCFYERSWSYFKVKVKDPAGHEIGSGTMWFGQNETFGGYYADCRAPNGFDWTGVTCDDDHGQTVTITKVG